MHSTSMERRISLETTKERILSALLSLKEDVSELRSKIERLRSEAKNPRQLLSMRAAAKRLGVDRQKVLAILVRDGLVQHVRVNGKLRIPVTEIDRLAREGFSLPSSAARPPATSRKTVEPPGEIIRRLKF